MGAANKLLISGPDGRPMLAHSLDSLRDFGFEPLIVVTGHEAAAVEAALGAQEARLVRAPDYADGLAASLRAGIAALPASVTAALVALGDMPCVARSTIAAMRAACAPGSVVVPRYQGRIGNPVLWDSAFFADMARLRGDRGARSLLPAPPALVTLDVEDPGVLMDVDTPESLAEWRSR